MTPHHAERFQRTTKALRASLLVILQHIDELTRLAEAEVATPVSSPPTDIEPICRLDRQTFSVYWQQRACFLGYTLPFRLLERLAQRSNQYVSVDRLVQDLWGGPKAPSTIRSAVSDLRFKLRAAGMSGLADMIDGSNPGHYGLIGGDGHSRPDALPTVVRRQSDSRREVHR
ncbi:MAG: hypothetical protein HBSAPP03_14810 [Phycisphaerae bacterium]|nr:MAG: hypothetical protein HBSAPP03_14810 [Phycisphaerae bacterium]